MSTNKKTKNKRAKSAKKVKAEKKDYLSAYMIVLSLLALFFGIFMYVNGEGGIVSSAVKYAVCGLFGRVGLFLPLVIAGLTIYLGKFKNIRKFWLKSALVLLLMMNMSALIGLYQDNNAADAFFTGGNDCIGGGACGAAIAWLFTMLIRKGGAYIALSLTMVFLAGAITGVPIFAYIGKFIKNTAMSAQEKYTDYRDLHENDEVRTVKPRAEKKRSVSAVEAANSFAEDNAETKDGEDKKSKKKKTDIQDTDMSLPEVFDENPPESKGRIESDGIDEVFGAMEKKTEDKREPKTEQKKNTEKQEIAEEKADSITKAEQEKYHKEFNEAIEKPVVKYVFPPLSLLNPKKNTSSDHREEMRRTAEKLISILDDFNVKAKLLQVTQGPTVTRYEIQPDTGIKLSKIVGLADDLALNLAVSTVLVAPVPGKAAVGVEIPNKKVSSVSIREMLESKEFNGAKSKLTVALGKDIGGNVVVGDVAKWPHVLIAGATGSGKSVCINTIVTSILYKASPEDVKLIMVDPKVVELGVYNGIPHLLVPVVTEPKKAAGALNWAVSEMMRRYDLFKNTGVRKLESYNKLMETTGGEKIPQLVIIIDELADLMMVAAKEVEDYICRLAQLARAAGIHLIIATQRPSVDVITGLIKANIPSRVAFAVSSQVDSRTIIDRGGAEKLLGMGDMLYYPTGSRSAIRVQGAFVSDEEIEKIIEFIKRNVGDVHYSDDLAEQIERCAAGENGVTPDVEEDGDQLLPDAIALAVELGKISTSMIQRRLGVGYSRAGRIIDQMEARGIISGANGSKPRDVLISHADMPMQSAAGDFDEDEDVNDAMEL